MDGLLMDGFWHTGLGILIATVAKTLALVVPLLLSVAYLTFAERKVLAAIQLRKGPNVVGPFGLRPADRRRGEGADEGDDRPLRRQSRAVPDRADPDLPALAVIAWAVIPVADGWAYRQHQRRHDVSVRDQLAGCLRHHHRRLGKQFEVRLPGRDALSAAQMVSYEVSMGFVIICVLLCVGSLNLNDVVLAQANNWAGGWFLGWFWLPLLPMFVDLLHLDPGGDQPAAVRPAGRR